MIDTEQAAFFDEYPDKISEINRRIDLLQRMFQGPRWMFWRRWTTPRLREAVAEYLYEDRTLSLQRFGILVPSGFSGPSKWKRQRSLYDQLRRLTAGFETRS